MAPSLLMVASAELRPGREPLWPTRGIGASAEDIRFACATSPPILCDRGGRRRRRGRWRWRRRRGAGSILVGIGQDSAKDSSGDASTRPSNNSTNNATDDTRSRLINDVARSAWEFPSVPRSPRDLPGLALTGTGLDWTGAAAGGGGGGGGGGGAVKAIRYLAASSCSVKINGIRSSTPSKAKWTMVETTTVVAFLPLPPESSMESSNIPPSF